jgi:hypothetical protein
MIKQAMCCDVCGKVQVMTDPEWDNVRYESPVPTGWIRITANYPSRFSFGAVPQADVREDLDVCSVSCATSRLYSYHSGSNE